MTRNLLFSCMVAFTAAMQTAFAGHAALAEGPAYRTHLAGVGLHDPRQRVDATQPPWSAVGRVQTELGSRCTGFLIAPNVVETAGHCLWLSHVRGFVQPESVHFLRAYTGDHYMAHARAVQIIIPPSYRTDQENNSGGLDHATLILDHAIAKPGEVFHINTPQQALTPGMPVVLGGYEQNQPDIITADQNCHFLSITQDGGGNPMLVHNCAGTHGSSGAPLLFHDQVGWHVIGVQVQAFTNGAGGRAVPLLSQN
ncbi:peptidase S1 [Acetobacter ascendens]|uniref:Peptidase S1 n=2 Tax=Acetobacter ascendens TaxID=481146 RepID=A0A1D8QTV6_9PROT|nr:trypsin-like serine protease [Acetobacter ascendens]AOW45768.1 peptidase S1 [Acetobacter ascendens]AOW50208.1 peptidase S1 [Acetobacter ascendens]